MSLPGMGQQLLLQTIPDINGKVTASDAVLKNVAAGLPKAVEKRVRLKSKSL